MELFYYIFIGFYFLILLILAVYGSHRYYLSYLYYRNRRNLPSAPAFENLSEIPFITIQLPLYNEKYVLPRLLQSVCSLDYPREKLQIQVLDDSTDETTDLARRLVQQYQNQGCPISLIHRNNRAGYKAGALKEGLLSAQGDLIAIFDADFAPEPDFLKRMVPYFSTDPKIGMVQARWGHLNADYSLLTRIQAIFLDGHFILEHGGRNRSGRFFNFNGTAGIWKKSCIEEAGGWAFDTLTEDLDLSYRAQLKGWKFLFVPDVVTPAELPVEMNGFKSQQHRWAKGSAQTAKKLIPSILKAKIPFKVKLEALFHLTGNFTYPLMVLLTLFMPISIYFRHQLGWSHSFYIDLPLFISATFSVTFFYTLSQKEIYRDWKKKLIYVPLNLALGIGLSINNAKAVLEALFNHKSEFKRTSKYAIESKTDHWKNKNYTHQVNWVTFIELFFGLYFLVTFNYALSEGVYTALPFIFLFMFGYFYFGLMGIFQSRSLLQLDPNQSNKLIEAEEKPLSS